MVSDTIFTISSPLNNFQVKMVTDMIFIKINAIIYLNILNKLKLWNKSKKQVQSKFNHPSLRLG